MLLHDDPPALERAAAQVLERIWGSSWQQPATVVEHVYRLRGKLAELPAPAPRITTVRGYGYRLDP